MDNERIKLLQKCNKNTVCHSETNTWCVAAGSDYIQVTHEMYKLLQKHTSEFAE